MLQTDRQQTDKTVCNKCKWQTKLYWHGLVFDKLTNRQAVMHYSRRDDYVTTPTYASTNDQQARPASPLLNWSKTKPRQFSSVTSLCTHLKMYSLATIHALQTDDRYRDDR